MNKPLILAVDDEVDFLEIASTLLESSGFNAATLTTPSEDELIHYYERVKPDLVLMDIHLAAEPVGLDLAAALRRNTKTAGAKIILWSVIPPPPGVADDFFNKSEDLSLLVAKIKTHLPDYFSS